jgi:hypothetical protein
VSPDRGADLVFQRVPDRRGLLRDERALLRGRLALPHRADELSAGGWHERGAGRVSGARGGRDGDGVDAIEEVTAAYRSLMDIVNDYERPRRASRGAFVPGSMPRGEDTRRRILFLVARNERLFQSSLHGSSNFTFAARGGARAISSTRRGSLSLFLSLFLTLNLPRYGSTTPPYP